MVLQGFYNFHLGQPTKCFSCEAQLPHPIKFLGGPTKCFDCERELAAKYGNNAAYHGKQQKCLSCGY